MNAWYASFASLTVRWFHHPVPQPSSALGCARASWPAVNGGRMRSASCKYPGYCRDMANRRLWSRNRQLTPSLEAGMPLATIAHAVSKDGMIAAHFAVLMLAATAMAVARLQRSLAVTRPRRPQSNAQGAGAGLEWLRADLAASACWLRRLRQCWGQSRVWRALAVEVAWGSCCR